MLALSFGEQELRSIECDMEGLYCRGAQGDFCLYVRFDFSVGQMIERIESTPTVCMQGDFLHQLFTKHTFCQTWTCTSLAATNDQPPPLGLFTLVHAIGVANSGQSLGMVLPCVAFGWRWLAKESWLLTDRYTASAWRHVIRAQGVCRLDALHPPYLSLAPLALCIVKITSIQAFSLPPVSFNQRLLEYKELDSVMNLSLLHLALASILALARMSLGHVNCTIWKYDWRAYSSHFPASTALANCMGVIRNEMKDCDYVAYNTQKPDWRGPGQETWCMYACKDPQTRCGPYTTKMDVRGTITNHDHDTFIQELISPKCQGWSWWGMFLVIQIQRILYRSEIVRFDS